MQPHHDASLEFESSHATAVSWNQTIFPTTTLNMEVDSGSELLSKLAAGGTIDKFVQSTGSRSPDGADFLCAETHGRACEPTFWHGWTRLVDEASHCCSQEGAMLIPNRLRTMISRYRSYRLLRLLRAAKHA